MEAGRGQMRQAGYHWHLRQVMATRNMFATTDLVPLLAERGVVLSREQVYRLVVGTPERLSLRTFAALCDILGCSPDDLFEPMVEEVQAPKRVQAGGAGADEAVRNLRPRPARIQRTET